ncbi:MAG: hypothetical protein A2Y76_11110 [Planctomycetes bacterium RBG_13_60_9]|nr:MAG: hypothetical protein A2Y76_11110 [Planctomycetes bacterium RBG_13_60_9]
MEQDRRSRRSARKPVRYDMRLFVAGDESNSVIAKASLRKICEQYLEGDCHVEVIDVLKDFRPALRENILVTPALIIQSGKGRTVIFGNLTNMDKILTALNLGSEIQS